MHGAGRVQTILLKDLLKGSISLPTIFLPTMSFILLT